MTQSIEKNFAIDLLVTDNAIYCDSLTSNDGYKLLLWQSLEKNLDESFICLTLTAILSH